MAHSKKSTCIAVLRHLTPLTANEFSSMIGRKVDWMKRIEAGMLPLRPHVARLVAHETGVSLEWLLRSEPNSPCVDSKGYPYSLETWHAYRAKFSQERPDQLSWCAPCAYLPMIYSIARAAADKYQVELFADDLTAALDKLAARYGQNLEGASVYKAHMAKHADAFNLVVSEKRAGDATTDAFVEFTGLAPKFLRDATTGGWLRIGRLAVIEKSGPKEKITIKMAKDGAHASATISMSKIGKQQSVDKQKQKKGSR